MILTPSDSFTRPANATAYAQGDLIANDTTAGNVTPMAFSVQQLGHNSAHRGRIRGARLFKDDETATNAIFTLHLFSVEPAVNNGDNGAFQPTTAANHLASLAIDMSSSAVASATDLNKQVSIDPAVGFDLVKGKKIYGLLEAEAAYQPTSGEQFTVTLEIEP